MPSALDRLEASTWRRFAPPPRLRVSAWADEHRVLSPEASAEPGRWRTSRVPYLQAVMDALNDRHVHTIVFCKSAQLGATEALINQLLYALSVDPGPTLFIMPTLELAAAFSKDRLQPALRDSPALRDLVGAPRSRDADNTILRKGVAGAVLTISGANSPSSLSSRPIRLLLADEIDRWPASIGAEGDPLALAAKRTNAFRRRKVVLASTPTVRGASRIEDWWEVSDKRLYHAPCPECGAFFVIEWKDVRWEDRDPSTAHLVCPACSARIEDHERPDMIARGAWRASAPFAGIAGFRAWEVLAPWRRLADIVASFLVAKRSIETRRVWVNTCLGQSWEEPGEQVDPGHLLLRRESYEAELPRGVACLTCGVDVQDDRLELVVVGWGAGEEAWIITRETLPGDPARPEPWAQLDELLARAWTHASGITLRILSTCIDSAGHRTQHVYDWVRPRQVRRVYATIGRAGGSHQVVSRPRPIHPARGGGVVLLHVVDVDHCKSLIASRLRLTERGPEYIHFPTSADEEFFAQLTAEKLVTKRNRFGVPMKVWEQTRPRNETLDAMVLALAALRLLAPPLPQWAATIAEAAAGRSATDPTSPAPVAAQAPKRRVGTSSYLSEHLMR